MASLCASREGSAHSRSKSGSLGVKRRYFHYVEKSRIEEAAAAAVVADVSNAANSADAERKPAIPQMSEVLQQMAAQAQGTMQEFQIAASEADLAKAQLTAGSGASTENSSSGNYLLHFHTFLFFLRLCFLQVDFTVKCTVQYILYCIVLCGVIYIL